MRKIRRKGQEEIVGFVVIVVIVAVVFLVILGLYLRQKAPATQKESKDVEQFLGSVMEYTSKCRTTQSQPYFSLGELIGECYDKVPCLSEGTSCDVLKRTMQEIIESNWRYGQDKPFKGYIFNSTYISDFNREEVLFMAAGNCTTERIGAEYLNPAQPGSITSSFQICL